MTDGQGLFLLVTPKGALHWRCRYRFAGKRETVALGTYPVVTLDWARSRHQSFRNLLAHGIDSSAQLPPEVPTQIGGIDYRALVEPKVFIGATTFVFLRRAAVFGKR